MITTLIEHVKCVKPDKINGLLQENMRPLVYYTIVFWVHTCTIGPTLGCFNGEMGWIALPFLDKFTPLSLLYGEMGWIALPLFGVHKFTPLPPLYGEMGWMALPLFGVHKFTPFPPLYREIGLDCTTAFWST